MARTSYITKMFLLLALLMTVLTLLIGGAISWYLSQTIEREVIDYNRYLQKLATDSSSQTINRLISLAREVSYDSYLVDRLYAYRKDTIDFPLIELAQYLEEKATKNIWVTFPDSNLITLYLLYQENQKSLVVAPRYADTTITMVRASYENLSTQMPTIFPIYEHPGKRGVQQFSFQIASPIIDPINNDLYGYILLDVSEKVLYDSYKEFQSESKMFVITDQEGKILSSKTKSMIGSTFLNSFDALLGQRASGYLKDDEQKAILFYQQIGGSDWYLVQKTDMKVMLASLQRMQVFITLLFVLSIVAMLFILAQFRRKTAQPVIRMNSMLDAVAGGDLSVRLLIPSKDEFGKMAQSFNTMVEEIDNLLETVTETEKAKRFAELDFLRAQINPHFIYNTLSSIRFSIEMNKTQNAREMLFHFTKLLRATLGRSDQFISLKEEMVIIDHYVNLQAYRYPGGFKLEKELDEQTLSYEVPSFILQPLVENAIFHNEGLSRVNIITIRTELKEGRLFIWVQDSGMGMNLHTVLEERTHKGSLNKVGLQNIDDRIQLNYGSEYGLHIESKEQVGTSILITIPARIYTGKEEPFNDKHFDC